MSLKSIEIQELKPQEKAPLTPLFFVAFFVSFFLPLFFIKINETQSNENNRTHQQENHDFSFLQLHIGNSFSQDQAYKWGKVKEKKNVGQMTVGLTYRPQKKRKNVDIQLRGELMSFLIDNQKLLKISFLPLFTLPSFDSQFPGYIGFGMGIGSFFKQIHKEAYFSLDYQLVSGFRLFEVMPRIGGFFEVGFKNHLFLFQNGKHKALYFSFGIFFRL